MLKPKLALLMLMLMLAGVGCSTVPQNGAMLADSVTLGIQRMESQTEAIITVLAEVQRQILNERWEEIYRSVEVKVRAAHQLSAGAPLDEAQRIEAATISTKVRDNVLSAIANKEAELKAQSLKNANQVIETNRVVRDYLMSLQDLDTARQKADKTIADLTGIQVSKLINTTRDSLQSTP